MPVDPTVPDGVAGGHRAALAHRDPGQVRVVRPHSARVLDHDQVAVTAAVPAGEHDSPATGGADRGAGRSRDSPRRCGTGCRAGRTRRRSASARERSARSVSAGSAGRARAPWRRRPRHRPSSRPMPGSGAPLPEGGSRSRRRSIRTESRARPGRTGARPRPSLRPPAPSRGYRATACPAGRVPRGWRSPPLRPRRARSGPGSGSPPRGCPDRSLRRSCLRRGPRRAAPPAARRRRGAPRRPPRPAL